MDDLRRVRQHPVLKNILVCILSFYKAQIVRLKALSPITTKTVDSAQATEYDIVFLSFVGTSRPVFVAEPHRLNVALTDARWMLGIYTTWSLAGGEHPHGSGKHLIRLFRDLKVNKPVITRQGMVMRCHNCQLTGHLAKDCNSPRLPVCIRCVENNDEVFTPSKPPWCIRSKRHE
jgi:hypothetical protein